MPQLLSTVSCSIYSTVDASNLLEKKTYKKGNKGGGGTILSSVVHALVFNSQKVKQFRTRPAL